MLMLLEGKEEAAVLVVTAVVEVVVLAGVVAGLVVGVVTGLADMAFSICKAC